MFLQMNLIKDLYVIIQALPILFGIADTSQHLYLWSNESFIQQKYTQQLYKTASLKAVAYAKENFIRRSYFPVLLKGMPVLDNRMRNHNSMSPSLVFSY